MRASDRRHCCRDAVLDLGCRTRRSRIGDQVPASVLANSEPEICESAACRGRRSGLRTQRDPAQTFSEGCGDGWTADPPSLRDCCDETSLCRDAGYVAGQTKTARIGGHKNLPASRVDGPLPRGAMPAVNVGSAPKTSMM